MSSEEQVGVLVVGGGPVGLTAALFLRHYGVAPMLAERHTGPSPLPRAGVINVRTMELMRSIGLERAIRDSPSPRRELPEMVSAPALAGEERYRGPMPSAGDGADASPTDWAPINQDQLDELLGDHALRAGIDLRFGTELVSFEQDPDGVTATLRERGSGHSRRVRASYLVAADGHRSLVRSELGIAATDRSKVVHYANLLFTADLTEALGGRPIGLAFLDTPVPGTCLRVRDRLDRWELQYPYRPERERLEDFDERRCVELVRAAVGVPDLELTLVPSPDGLLSTWEVGGRLAERYRDRRVLLAGDAAHLLPPGGGFGANLGIQDSHNLAWKLAHVLRDEAGPGLLDTYEEERRAVGDLTLEQALLHSQKLTGGAGAAGTMLPTSAVVMGYRYRSGAVLAESGDGAAALEPRALRGQPGTRAPHVPLERAGRPLSSLDLFGAEFVMLTGSERWHRAAEAVGVRTHRIGEQIQEAGDRWCDSYGVGPLGAVLVRPDGFVAWRAPGEEPDAERLLGRVIDKVLCRQVAPLR